LTATALAAGTGCGYLFGDQGLFPDKSDDYRSAQEFPVLQVPDGKSSDSLHEIYAIPPVQDDLLLAGEFEVPRPSPLVAGAADQLVRIQKLGDDSWALIAMAPGQVWPQVRSFLAAAGAQVTRVDARAGIMETDWVMLEGEPMASRFRFRIEQGVQRGNSELHVLQMHQAGDIENWPVISDDKEQESEILMGVSQYIANSADSSPVSMIADQSITATGKVFLQEAPEGYTYIYLGLPMERAWASLAKALEASTFEITDRDRSEGVYFVRFLGPTSAEEEGWFDWLFDEEEHPLAGQEFRAIVEPEGEDAVHIRLLPQDQQAGLGQREQQSLLALIKGSID
jgi:outer membrane protein assembly factor BamC